MGPQERRYFLVLKVCFAIISIAAFANLISSCWWLRTMGWDGSRFVFNLIQRHEPYYEMRPLHVLFQIPALLGVKHFPSLSPIDIARIYLLTIAGPIYLWAIHKILRSKLVIDLIPPFTLLMVGYLPGISFSLNSVLETSFFFMIMVDSLLKNRRVLFYISGFLVSLGHPALLPGFLIFAFLIYVDERKNPDLENKSRILSLLNMFLFGITLLLTRMNWTDIGKENSSFIYLYYKTYFFKSESISIHICTLIALFLVSDFLKTRWRIVIQSILLLSVCILLFTMETHLAFNNGATTYRLWTAGLTLGVCCFIWIRKKWIPSQDSLLLMTALMIIAPAYLYWDFRITADYKKFYEDVRSISVPPGCHEVTMNYPASHHRMMIPLYKIIIDNKKQVTSLVVSPDGKDPDACARIQEDETKIRIPMFSSKYFIGFPKNGYFDFSENLLK